MSTALFNNEICNSPKKVPHGSDCERNKYDRKTSQTLCFGSKVAEANGGGGHDAVADTYQRPQIELVSVLYIGNG